MAKGKKALRGRPNPSVIVPVGTKNVQTPPSTSPVTPVTPKTPADEGITFFESELQAGECPIRVYELHLDPDGGPNTEKSVSSRVIRRKTLTINIGSTVYSFTTTLCAVYSSCYHRCRHTRLQEWSIQD